MPKNPPLDPTVSETAPAAQGQGLIVTVRQPPASPGLVLVFPHAGDEPPCCWRVRGACTIGRSPQAEIRVEDPKLSRSHATVESCGDGIRVTDLGSRHGTFVDGASVRDNPVLASPGSIVRCGDSVFLSVREVAEHQSPLRRLTANFLGTSRDVVAGPVLAGAWDQATRVASLKVPVLVVGESGSGKEAIARIIHASGSRKKAPFVAINLAAVPESLFEAELFGYERGAFTGAVSSRLGAFREATGGVLFLDEVADLRLDLQAKLLRVLDQQTVRPLGGNKEIPIDVRLVSATSRDLRAACDSGTYRTDLYYRLAGYVIAVPPLRERREEIVGLAQLILQEEGSAIGLSADAAVALLQGTWEGNVRQLRHAVLQGLANAHSAGSPRIEVVHLPAVEPARRHEEPLTEQAIRQAFARAAGVASQAAKALGVSRTTLYNTCKRLGIDVSSLRED